MALSPVVMAPVEIILVTVGAEWRLLPWGSEVSIAELTKLSTELRALHAEKPEEDLGQAGVISSLSSTEMRLNIGASDQRE